MLENIRNYILTCPLLDTNGKLGVECLDNDAINYSIEETSSQQIIEINIDGSSRRQFLFSLTSREYFGQDEIEQNLTNSKFYENFSNWLEKNTNNKILPSLDKNKKAESVKSLSSGYLFSIDDGMKIARYKIQCQLIYEMEEL